MKSTNTLKRVTAGALLAGTAVVAGLGMAAGTANADTVDDQFLAALQQQGVGFGTTGSAIGVAHHVCNALGEGMEPSDISTNIAAANNGIDRHTAVVIIVTAAQSYCPQYVHRMANGATVVGPNH